MSTLFGSVRRGAAGLALLLAALAFGAMPAAAQGGGWVVGRVTDFTGRPVHGATVQVLGSDTARARFQATSEETGGFQFVSLPSGRYRVRVALPGYAQQEDSVTVAPGARHTVIVRLREAPRSRRQAAPPPPAPRKRATRG
jgi:protocatechuate 3,4-dioxygenase beta subunit